MWIRARSVSSPPPICGWSSTWPVTSVPSAGRPRSPATRTCRWRSRCSSTTTRTARISPRWCAPRARPVARVLLLPRSGATGGGPSSSDSALTWVARVQPLEAGPRRTSPTEPGRARPIRPRRAGLRDHSRVHEADEGSIMPRWRSRPRSARGYGTSPPAPTSWSPLTLSGTTPQRPTIIDARGLRVRRRVDGRSVCGLAPSGVGLTLHERADLPCSRPRRSHACSAPVGAHRTGLDALEISDTRRVGALAAGGLPLLLANLTPDAQEVRVKGSPGPGSRSLTRWRSARSPR